MPAPKKTIYIDMDDVLVDFSSAIEILDDQTKQQYAGHLDDVPGIFNLMNPVPGAVETFNQLADLYDVYILSTAPWDNPSAWSDKLQWVKRHLGSKAYKRLILTHHKDLNKGDFLIDDREKNGADNFKGELILFGSEKFKDWNCIREYLLRSDPKEPNVSSGRRKRQPKLQVISEVGSQGRSLGD
jgi:5'-nucleotidase